MTAPNVIWVTEMPSNSRLGACHIYKLTGATRYICDDAPELMALVEAISPLVAIADAFDANELDDEARKFWGQHSVNTTPHENIVLYSGRGGKEMLTLADCMKARATLARLKGVKHDCPRQ